MIGMLHIPDRTKTDEENMDKINEEKEKKRFLERVKKLL